MNSCFRALFLATVLTLAMISAPQAQDAGPVYVGLGSVSDISFLASG